MNLVVFLAALGIGAQRYGEGNLEMAGRSGHLHLLSARNSKILKLVSISPQDVVIDSTQEDRSFQVHTLGRL